MILGGLTAVIGIAVIATAVLVTKRLIGRKQVDPADVAVPEYVNVNLLTPNEYSRPQIPLEKVNKEEIKAKMDEYALARKTKQPLEYPSAGSTFKRPEGC